VTINQLIENMGINLAFTGGNGFYKPNKKEKLWTNRKIVARDVKSGREGGREGEREREGREGRESGCGQSPFERKCSLGQNALFTCNRCTVATPKGLSMCPHCGKREYHLLE